MKIFWAINSSAWLEHLKKIANSTEDMKYSNPGSMHL